MSSKWHGGKGDKPRPVVDRKQFEDNWDRIWGKTPKPESGQQPQHKSITQEILDYDPAEDAPEK